VPDDRITFITFANGAGSTPVERLVAGSRLAAAEDLVDVALACPLIGHVIVATNADELAERLAGRSRVVVERDRPGKAFHFGRRLAEIIERYEAERPLYFGGAAAPLLAPESLEELCEDLLASQNRVIANNLASADFFGFTPAAALRRIDLPAQRDNRLPYLLTRQAGLRGEQMESAIENAFDIDTPTDLAILRLLEGTKPRLRAYLERAALDTRRLEQVLPALVGYESEITLIGRVDTGIWGAASPDSPGIRRLFVEERTMVARGRDVRGEVRSMLGYLLEAVGPRAFFADLARLSTAVFFDTRVIFYHLSLRPSEHDRFASDLGDVDAIEDSTIRDFTAAALDCEVPVILGGRNVVAGGLWALTQEAWNRADSGLLSPK
jgi:hypothetical protein